LLEEGPVIIPGLLLSYGIDLNITGAGTGVEYYSWLTVLLLSPTRTRCCAVTIHH